MTWMNYKVLDITLQKLNKTCFHDWKTLQKQYWNSLGDNFPNLGEVVEKSETSDAQLNSTIM